MILWTSLLNVLILLVAAMLLGGIFERLKQHAVLGYLFAGALIGPHVLDLMPNHEAIASIAELGVALLLFMIGLEFSWRRLRSLGGIALGGGTLQVMATIVVSMLVAVTLGLEVREALVVSAMVALSSTAIVMRLLADRAAVDSVYGRNVLGILLLQDIAVVPLVLLVTLLGSQGTALQFGWAAVHALGAAILLVGALFLVLKYILPLMFRTREPGGNQDLPVLLSTVTALGCAWGSHWLGLSPILGAFVGGVILAESPFANRIRADIAPLKTLFITLFFTSIGMLANPLFVLSNWQAVLAITVAILLGKTFVITFVTRLFRTPMEHALATGICLAQIGEFSFVLAEVSRSTQLISAHLFDLMISVTVVTLFITPFLVSFASKVPGYLGRIFPSRREEGIDTIHKLSDCIVIIGFGPAGKTVTQELLKEKHSIVVIEMNTATADEAVSMGVRAVIGDATQLSILRDIGVESAKAVVITVPDPVTAQHIIAQIRLIASNMPILVRARYNRHLSALIKEGATVAIDEETEVGIQLAAQLRKRLHIE